MDVKICAYGIILMVYKQMILFKDNVIDPIFINGYYIANLIVLPSSGN